jgi:hypothetical protein
MRLKLAADFFDLPGGRTISTKNSAQPVVVAEREKGRKPGEQPSANPATTERFARIFRAKRGPGLDFLVCSTYN